MPPMQEKIHPTFENYQESTVKTSYFRFPRFSPLHFGGLLLIAIIGCDSGSAIPKNSQEGAETMAEHVEVPPTESPPMAHAAPPGRALAEKHCSRCHLTPEPQDLPSDRWEFTIAWMAHYFGYPSFTEADRSIVLQELVPEQPTVKRIVLEDILRYYLAAAGPEIPPDREALPAINYLSPRRDLHFLPQNRSVTCVKIDEANERLFVGDALRNRLWEFTFQGTVIAQHPTSDTQVVGVTTTKDGFFATLIGHFLLDGDHGKVMLHRPNEATARRYTFPVDDYFRIAHCLVADVNQDGWDDLLVSGFGARFTGAFSIFWGNPESPGDFIRQDLRNNNGAVCSGVTDVDGDGDLDVLLLTAQGHHELMLFRNLSAGDAVGEHRFGDELVMRNRPSFGGNGFRLADFDGDGKDEIVLFSGNNMEMHHSPVRGYHGVYIYSQDQDGAFREIHFQHLPGAIGVAIDDFDMDGDLDIVSASSLPDWRIPKPRSTVMLTNEGRLNFSVGEIASTAGMQWVSLDSGDIDADGDPDLILGGLDFVPEASEQRLEHFRAATKSQSSVFVVENATFP